MEQLSNNSNIASTLYKGRNCRSGLSATARVERERWVSDCEKYLDIGHRNKKGRGGVDSSDSRKVLVIEFCEHGNESLCSITGKRVCQLVKRTLPYEVSG
jgi:hypothetical protein